jgi:hypothetical protein
MIQLFLWLALMIANFAAMAAIIWIERVYSVPQLPWLGMGNFLIFGTLLMAVDVAIYIPINRKYRLLQRRKPGTLELLLRVAWWFFSVAFYAVIGLQSSRLMERFIAVIAVAGGSLSMYSSVRDVIKRYRERWT